MRNNDNNLGTFAMLKYDNDKQCCFLLTSLRKDYFLRRRIQRYRFLMAEIPVLLVLDIRLPASSRISMRNQFVYDGWIKF